MKVLPQDHLTPASHASPLQSAHKGDQSFAGLLKNPGNSIVPPQPQRAEIQQAAGFGELGMFGRYGDRTAHIPKPGREPAWRVADASGLEQDRELPSAAVAPASLSENEQAGAFSTASHTEAGHAPTDPGLQSDVMVLGSSSAAGEACTCSVEEVPVREETAAASRREVCEPRSNPSVSVQVSEDGCQLSVIARSNNPHESYSDTRQMIEDAAAEFGKKLSDFYLNGTAPQSFTSALGGPHGSRTR